MKKVAMCVAIVSNLGTAHVYFEKLYVLEKKYWFLWKVFWKRFDDVHSIKFARMLCREWRHFTPVAILWAILSPACAVSYVMVDTSGQMEPTLSSCECVVHKMLARMFHNLRVVWNRWQGFENVGDNTFWTTPSMLLHALAALLCILCIRSQSSRFCLQRTAEGLLLLGV